ncbi:PP2C family protein-serine/threonine phosphatase [Ureaplasma parvum]|uniref:PP2C family protein-serine/threonine phosphatase n=1 Tax=Ureaplasma parvum TaxID=134821 RepID=UPI0026EDCA9D|nr:PP2C family serine/threonine-protein phosphatase [Ureaplasma parvum]
MNFGFISDIGSQRKHNDDCALVIQNQYQQTLLIVCDGLGGYKGGAAASHITLETIKNNFLTTDFSEYDKQQIQKWYIKVIKLAQVEIDRTVLLDKDVYNMGTTVVASIVVNDFSYTLNIGDSRAYLLSNEQFLQISHDHNLLQVLQARKANPEVYKKHEKNLFSLTQFVGRTSNIFLSYDLFVNKLNPNEIIVLTSDGFHNYFELNTLYEKLIKSTKDTKNELLQQLIRQAIINGSNDNLSLAFLIF